MRISVSILAVAVAVLSIFGATRATNAGNSRLEQAQGSTAEVKIDNFVFGPQTLTVSAGTTVTWVNNDDIPHTVVSNDRVFKSKVLDTNDKFSYTFAKAGTYPYFCSIHPKMTAKVVVQ